MSVYSLPDSPVGTQAAMGPVLLALSGVAAFVLLLVCLNIASLMLVRSGARRREVAIRMALGATRIDLARQFLSESMLLALLGGICGVVAAQAAVKAVPSLAPTIGVPLALDFPIDWAALTVNFAVAVAAGFACALLPAYQASRIEPASVLREEGGSIAGSRRHARWRDALSVSQIALSFTLLVCAGLFLRSVQRAERIDLGFNPRDVHLASIDLASSSYTREAGERFYQRLRERLKGLPGVKSVALAHTVPLGFGGNDRAEFLPAGYQAKPGETMTAWLNSITPDYFATMGVPLLRGRGFAETDTESSPRVAIINETLANRYWPGADAVGRRFSTAGAQVEVVGVAKDYYTSSLKRSNLPYFYVPLAQSYQPRTTIHVRSGEAPRAVAAAIERAVSLGDPELAVSDEETLEAHVRGATFAQHLASVLLAVFGLVALYLTILGVYGTLAQMVKNRVKEIGIRIALGATPGGIRNMVLKRALFLGAAGAAIGCALSSAAAVLASGLLIGVRPLDFISIGTAGVLIITTTMAAAYFPARRAARQDPAESIRRD
jgi:predicted permease